MTDSTFDNYGQSLANITTAINQYVVAPIAAFGLAGFVFSTEGDSLAELSADITDHYTEDNKAIQDHIAIRPKRITLKGYVGELIYTGATEGNSAVNTLAQKLTSLSSFLPAITSAATQTQQAIADPSSISFTGLLSDTSNIYALVKNTLGSFGGMQNQQNAYTYFKALLQSGTLCSIQTPWEFMTNMAIEHIRVVQPENTQWLSEFSVSYKEIRIASTLTQAILAPVANAQQSPATNLGAVSGAPVAGGTSTFTSSGATGSW